MKPASYRHLALWLTVGLPSFAVAQQNEVAKLLASDGTESDRLGTSVAVSGDTVLAGAPLRSAVVDAYSVR